MSHISSGTLYIILSLLILLSAFFSSSETGLMSLNRHRLNYLAKKGSRGAKLPSDFLIALIVYSA